MGTLGSAFRDATHRGLTWPRVLDGRRPRRVVVQGLIVTVLLVGGCNTGAVPADQMALNVSNESTMAVNLVVNGAVIETLNPGVADSLPASRLPGLPWAAEVQTAAGRPLINLIVHDGDVGKSNGVAHRVDLSCGRIDIWSGPPLGGPAPGPGAPSDCDP